MIPAYNKWFQNYICDQNTGTQPQHHVRPSPSLDLPRPWHSSKSSPSSLCKCCGWSVLWLWRIAHLPAALKVLASPCDTMLRGLLCPDAEGGPVRNCVVFPGAASWAWRIHLPPSPFNLPHALPSLPCLSPLHLLPTAISLNELLDIFEWISGSRFHDSFEWFSISLGQSFCVKRLDRDWTINGLWNSTKFDERTNYQKSNLTSKQPDCWGSC